MRVFRIVCSAATRPRGRSRRWRHRWRHRSHVTWPEIAAEVHRYTAASPSALSTTSTPPDSTTRFLWFDVIRYKIVKTNNQPAERYKSGASTKGEQMQTAFVLRQGQLYDTMGQYFHIIFQGLLKLDTAAGQLIKCHQHH